ncbi:N-acetylmuramoyl-L-alanine amidase [Mariprofundus sp. EBB-1]|uniref:N-acetylmuramoyl-L-alanine amidase n=1 Tax=Mariprofundus sp. EBB-1 TaxID=2650971 RepID=UPI001F30839F|nr:N-acetylmuramoyl-L-alanine amidase [Mariprofundus sp. EBB-1]
MMNLRFSIFTYCCGLLLLMCPLFAYAASNTVVRDVRLWTAPDHTRLVFDLSGTMNYKLFRLHEPERIVIDMERVTLKSDLKKLSLPDPVIEKIRSGSSTPGSVRIVIDVKEKVQPRSFLLKPMKDKPNRLVVDLMRPEKTTKVAKGAMSADGKKQLVIAVDAGHGGEDPGATGPHKVREKDITLAVAKKLAKKINAHPGMKAILIREGDYFVALQKRVALARKMRADLMISIHADAINIRSVKGASVYTLSEKGATPDRAARALAAKENAADDVGGVAFEQINDPLVNLILGDMLRRASLNSSQLLAEEVLMRLKKVGPVKYTEPKHARFYVLKAMEIPSVLVELDFISNPAREKKLKSARHQNDLASALFDASVGFFRKMGRLKQSNARNVQPPYRPLASALDYASAYNNNDIY